MSKSACSQQPVLAQKQSLKLCTFSFFEIFSIFVLGAIGVFVVCLGFLMVNLVFILYLLWEIKFHFCIILELAYKSQKLL